MAKRPVLDVAAYEAAMRRQPKKAAAKGVATKKGQKGAKWAPPKKSPGSGLERAFETLWGRYGRWRNDGWEGFWIPEREHVFHETRKWRLDFAWPEQKVAVEIEGGIYTKGGHTRVNHFISDCDKYNALALAGWRLFRFTEKHLSKRPVECCELVAEALAKTGASP